MAKQTVVGYIVVPSEKLLLRVNRDGSYEVILSDKEYDQWQARARAAEEDRSTGGTPR